MMAYTTCIPANMYITVYNTEQLDLLAEILRACIDLIGLGHMTTLQLFHLNIVKSALQKRTSLPIAMQVVDTLPLW